MSPNSTQRGDTLEGVEEEGGGVRLKASVLSPVTVMMAVADGPPKQKRPQSCDEIRAKTIKDGASFAVWT